MLKYPEINHIKYIEVIGCVQFVVLISLKNPGNKYIENEMNK